MKLLETFGIVPDKPELIAVTGGGGKTTTIFALAAALKKQGKKVLVTTTTNMFVPGEDQCDMLVLTGRQEPEFFSGVQPGTVVCLGGGIMEGKPKLKSVEPAYIDALFQQGLFDMILVEADGAKRKPIKAPADYEPVIPALATLAIGVVGMDALGKSIIEDNVHRVELFCNLTGSRQGEVIDGGHIAALATEKQGLFKGTPDGCRKMVLLNKSDDAALIEQAGQVARAITAGGGGIHGVVIGAVQQGSVERV